MYVDHFTGGYPVNMVAGVFRRVYTGMVKYRYIPVYTRARIPIPGILVLGDP